MERAVANGSTEGIEVMPLGGFAELWVWRDVNDALLWQHNVLSQLVHGGLLVLWIEVGLSHLLPHHGLVVVQQDGATWVGLAHLVIKTLHPAA